MNLSNLLTGYWQHESWNKMKNGHSNDLFWICVAMERSEKGVTVDDSSLKDKS